MGAHWVPVFLGFDVMAVFFAFMAMSPEFTGLLLTDPLGRMMLGGAIVLEALGFMVIKKIVNIEV